MRVNDDKWNVFAVLKRFFPFQLISSHIKNNLFSLFFWMILFLIITERIGSPFGIPLLFLSPEYLGEVSPLSFAIVGFAIGGFIMGFNTYSYIKIGAHYPFLITISKPFLRFCINNSVIPLLFNVVYIVKIIQFQKVEESADSYSIFLYILFYLIGITFFLLFSLFYFFPASKRNSNHFNSQSLKPINSIIHKREKWYEIFKREKHKTSIYFGKNLKLMASRSSTHFDKELVERVYARNRISSSIYELLTISIFFGLGFFNSFKLLEVPAAASIVLLITISSMLFSALHSWFRNWVYLILFIAFILMDFLSIHTGAFNYKSYAYGLNYNAQNTYSMKRLGSLSTNESINEKSLNDYIQTLENWKVNTNQTKPKLIIINSSGGGSRSALWTMTVLQKLNQSIKNGFNENIQLIAGASGGMIGAAYYRELLLETKIGKQKLNDDEFYCDNISKDILNKLTFMASTNDIFIRYQSCEFNGYSYVKDRGFAFEEQLHNNTENKLNKSLGYYYPFEKEGKIPTMIFSPTIINDGRRLLISSQDLSFITSSANNNSSFENVEFHQLLRNQKANNVRFSSILRASATFPFVMPMITLPTIPEVQLMDAGIRDNYGGKTTMQYLSSLKDWIKENTSGVVVIQIRDVKKVMNDESYKNVSFLDKITLPFGNMYKNFPKVQDFNQDELISISKNGLGFPIDIISFNLLESRKERISLSWHLTSEEKKKIHDATESKLNRAALNELQKILN
jgi:predicted patatin/cPLA2 family phospholipase